MLRSVFVAPCASTSTTTPPRRSTRASPTDGARPRARPGATPPACIISVSRPRPPWTRPASVGGRPYRRRRLGRGLHRRRHRERQPRHSRRRRGPGAHRPAPPDHHRHRARSRAEHRSRRWRAAAGASPCCPSTHSGIVSPERLREALHRRHRARVGDARQQRDRHHPAGRRDGRVRARARRARPHRCRADRRQDPGGRAARSASTCCRSSGHKFYGPKGTGALWVQRGVRLVAAASRRPAGAQPPRRHRERAGTRRAWRGRGDAARSSMAHEAHAAGGAARPPRSRHAGARAGHRASTAPPNRACRTRPTSASTASRPSRC